MSDSDSTIKTVAELLAGIISEIAGQYADLITDIVAVERTFLADKGRVSQNQVQSLLVARARLKMSEKPEE